MKVKTLTYLFLIVSISAIAVNADEWRLSVGPNYRTFGDIDFDANAFSASKYAASYNGVTYVDGSVIRIGGAGARYIVDNALQQISPPTLLTATFHHVAFSGDDDSTDSALGIVFEASTPLSVRGDWVFGLDISLNTAFLRQGSAFGANAVLNSFAFPPGMPWPSAGPGIPADGPVTSGNNPSPTASTAVGTLLAGVERDLDLNLYTAGIGLSAARSMGRLNTRFGAGPALFLADCETSTLDWARWQTAGEVYRNETSDTTYQVLGGAYVSAEVGVDITERMQFGVKARYDYAFSDLSFHGGELDLSGFGAQVLLSIDF